VQQLLQQQDPDGGWSQLDQLGTDAYATGLSLYSLHEAGVPVTDKAYRQGVAFLLRKQYPDGSWLVKTRAFPMQPYFESGYPFGSNQWISAAGASWASLAIAYSLPDVQTRKSIRR
jgi:N-acyl-D-amino-acid deacylase